MCGDRLASAVDTWELTVWDLKTRSRMAVISDFGFCEVSCIEMSDSVLVIASDKEPYLRAYSVANNYSCVGAEAPSIGFMRKR